MESTWETRELRKAQFQERLELDMDRVAKECLDSVERLAWADLNLSPTALDQWIETISAALLKLRAARAAKFRMVRA